MRRKFLSRDLWFKKAAPSPVQLRKEFYLTVLAARMPLPAPLVVVNPKGEGGAVAGFLAPLGDKDKSALGEPLDRGAYAVASPDQKTVLRLTVISKEEAGFDPDRVLSSPLTHALDSDIRAGIAGTWMLLQLTIESYDPAVYPALDFLLGVARRLAELTDGAVADAVSQVYRSAGQVQMATPAGQPLAVQNVVATHLISGLVVTAGMAKIGQAEIALAGVPESNVLIAEHFLMGVALAVWKGEPLSIGQQVAAGDGAFSLVPSAHHPLGADRLVYELSPDQGTDPNPLLQAWWRGAHGNLA